GGGGGGGGGGGAGGRGERFRALGGGWQAAPSPSHQENGQ
ncbi:hypothetical protein, partial [Pseudomonas aeruginosa]